MPELPEVEVMVRYLRGLPEGYVTSFEGHHKTFKLQACYLQQVIGQEIHEWYRKAKYIVAETDNGCLITHNKFTGYWSSPLEPFSFDYLEYDRPPTTKDLRLTMSMMAAPGGVLDDYAPFVLNFHDARCLGSVVYEDRPAKDVPYLAKMGPDVVLTSCTHPDFAQEWTMDHLWESCRTRRDIKSVLLDQSNQAGIGNIYACETLHRVKVNPLKAAQELAREQVEQVWAIARQLVQLAMDMKVQYDSYVQIFRAKTCMYCQGEVTRAEQAGRGTYFCKSCQI